MGQVKVERQRGEAKGIFVISEMMNVPFSGLGEAAILAGAPGAVPNRFDQRRIHEALIIRAVP